MVRLLFYIYGFLAFCSAVTFLHPHLRSPAGRGVRRALNAWWPTALLGGAVVLGGAGAAVPLFAALSAWTLREYLGLLPAADRHPLTDALAYAAVPVHYAALIFNLSGRGDDGLFYGAVLLWTFGALPLCAAALRGPAQVLQGVPRLQLGVVLTVLALSHVPRLFTLPPCPPAGAAGLCALLLLCVMTGDGFQFFFGKLLGRRPLAPVLSPNKTWEGLLGGVAMSALAAAAAGPLVTPFSAAQAAPLGAALCLCGLGGDLLVSAIKRSAGAKDTGAVLPGQGGVLDRCDSLLFSAPLYAHCVAAWLS